ncbi:immunoglobulin-like domain-containing receptor 1 [Brienomyrus brachyistius]|uniref:immunoglobulin-like domain-containing receptor 1 n=1 Tax=Brienomyrus brachyistius TaxID=42636 RepID=UPI0020B35813|nr:immunoglobulin-like domain-containing receptor 1 [Brienomyrus brachyistius]
MGKLILIALVLAVWPSDVLSVQVSVPETRRVATLFASVVLRCDYTTSANQQDVIVSWTYKSFCKDPVLEYYTAAYQAALSIGQNPADDCPDSQRTIRTVAQKRGTNEAILGTEYQQRKITIQNKADLAITEVMWWDNGMYYCSVVAPGDPIGGLDGRISLIVLQWLVVLLIILGGLLLIILISICWCQCCPQHCCCYVRCPCCPQSCCCPEKAVMQHKMMKDAQKAMAPWVHGQPIYAPISHASSMHMHPLLYSDPSKQGLQMGTLPLPPPPGALLAAHSNGSLRGTNQTLDYLENQVRNMDVNSTLMSQPSRVSLQQMPPPAQHMGQAVPYVPGPPSMLSSLNEMGMQGMERRVIQLPPIVERPASRHSGYRPSSRNTTGTNRSSHYRNSLPPQSRREASPTRRGPPRSYSDDSDVEERRRTSRSRQSRSRSRDDLMDEMRRTQHRHDRSYSPEEQRRGSWSSEEDYSSRKGGTRSRGGGTWPEKPPSYTSIDIAQGRKSNGTARNNERCSEKSSRSAKSIVI